ncbi:MAG: ATP-binding cassette domain-containing protein [Granulosicoccus sp.]|nr:ATP-binding cassette domain-containing protein [Granulosicoccus sp.]
MTALQTHNLAFSYGKHKALDGVSLTVPPGRFVALLGANGAGKTTFFSIVTGLYAAHAGSVSVMENDIRKNTLKALAAMGVVFQRSTLDMDLTVVQNLRYAAALQGIARSEANDRIAEGIVQHGLSGFETRKVTALSGGQKRRVELARALLHKPSLLLLDEPTVGLDLQSRSDFVNHVKSLCSEQGTGVLWATHLMDEVTEEDLAVFLHKGKVISEGKVIDLMNQYDSEDVTELFNTQIERQAS